MRLHESPVAWAVEDIHVGERDRSDLGDVQELADSIASVGLLHPVVVTSDGTLVAGGRRLAAVELLGWSEVPVTVAANITDAETALRAEQDENTCRKALTPVEAARARERRARLLRPLALARQGHGSTAPGRPNASGKLPEASPVVVRDAAAVGTGFSGKTLDKVDKVRAIAEDPDESQPVREAAVCALDEMEHTGRVDGAVRRVEEVRQAGLSDAAEKRAAVAPLGRTKKPARQPLSEAFFRASSDLIKTAEKLERLAADDRFPQKAEQVAAKHRSDLTRAAETLARVLDRLPT